MIRVILISLLLACSAARPLPDGRASQGWTVDITIGITLADAGVRELHAEDAQLVPDPAARADFDTALVLADDALSGFQIAVDGFSQGSVSP